MVRVLRLSRFVIVAALAPIVVVALWAASSITHHPPGLSRPLEALAPTPLAFYPDASAFCKAAALDPIATAATTPDDYTHGLLGVLATSAPTIGLRDELVSIERTIYVDHGAASAGQISQATQDIATECKGAQ